LWRVLCVFLCVPADGILGGAILGEGVLARTSAGEFSYRFVAFGSGKCDFCLKLGTVITPFVFHKSAS